MRNFGKLSNNNVNNLHVKILKKSSFFILGRMSKKTKPTLHSAAREGNVADLELIFQTPEINPNEVHFLIKQFIIIRMIFIF